MQTTAEEEQVARAASGADIAPEDRITMTPRAVDHVKKQMQQNSSALGFRLGIRKTGCSGFAYVVDFAQSVNETDLAFAVDEELTVYVDAKSFDAVRGTRIDFVRNGLNHLFKFENPNIKGECGCGESFSI